MSETMIERVARAIAQADEQNGGPPYEYRITYKHAKEHLFDEARASIEAMRLPTEGMVQVVSANWGRRTWAEYNEVIDAALKEQTK